MTLPNVTQQTPTARIDDPFASPVNDDGPADAELSLAPVQRLDQGSSKNELLDTLRRAERIGRQALADPTSIGRNREEVINIIEKLMVLLAKEERKAKHDRFAAKMTKLVERITKLLSAAKKTLEAGRKELDAISKKSGWQIAFAVLAVVVIVAAIALTPALGPAALMVGLAVAGALLAAGGPAGELAAKGDTEEKQELNEESADLNAIATELEKLFESENELSSEAKELLRKLLEILMKIFEKLNATRRKQAEGVAQ